MTAIMPTVEQIRDAKKYFKAIGEAAGSAREKDTQLETNVHRDSFQVDLMQAKIGSEYAQAKSILSAVSFEKKVVRSENLPTLLSNIRNSNDALIAVAILDEGQRDPLGRVTYGQIRNSLKRKMRLSTAAETDAVLGKYTSLQGYCDSREGEIFER